ncbi:hypothetical protein HDU97_005431 [Phlyctochytrium planicorne]|nr:hypothetical protein HDU97_005431 [Phlyctochytrium planicorne]
MRTNLSLILTILLFIAIAIQLADSTTITKTKKKKSKKVPKKPVASTVVKAPVIGSMDAVDMACHFLHNGAKSKIGPFNYYPSLTKKHREEACGTKISIGGTSMTGQAYCNQFNLVCDEYPFASSKQGGKGATVFCVPKDESQKQAVAMSKVTRDAKKNRSKYEIQWTSVTTRADAIKNCLAHLKATCTGGCAGMNLAQLTTLPDTHVSLQLPSIMMPRRSIILHLAVMLAVMAMLINQTIAVKGTPKKPTKTVGLGHKPHGGIAKKTKAPKAPVAVNMACHFLHNGAHAQIGPFNYYPSLTKKHREEACGTARTINGHHMTGQAYCNQYNLVCDEYPFASSKQGGKGASVFCVPKDESQMQAVAMSGVTKKAKKARTPFYIKWASHTDRATAITNCLNHLRTNCNGCHGMNLKQLTTLHDTHGDLAGAVI